MSAALRPALRSPRRKRLQTRRCTLTRPNPGINPPCKTEIHARPTDRRAGPENNAIPNAGIPSHARRRDDLLAASLGGAFGNAGLALFRIRRHETKVQYVERIELGFRIRDMARMPDRRIALLDDSGRVAFLARSWRCDIETRRLRPLYAMGCGPIEAAEER